MSTIHVNNDRFLFSSQDKRIVSPDKNIVKKSLNLINKLMIKQVIKSLSY